MKISIGLPTRDSARTLGEALESALSQDFGDFELIVADNASTDGTRDLVGAFRDPRIRYHRHPEDLGYTRNARWCLERAEGEIMAFLCSDDYWRKDFLGSCLKAFRSSDRVTLAYSAYDVLRQDPDGILRFLKPPRIRRPALCGGIDYVREEFARPVTILSGSVFRRRTALEAGSFGDPSLRFLPDFVHRLRVAARGDVAFVDEPLAVYRVHGGSLGARSRAVEWLHEEMRLMDALAGDVEFRDAGLERLRPKRQRSVAHFIAQRMADMKEWGASRGEIAALASMLRDALGPGALTPRGILLTLLAYLLPPAALRVLRRMTWRARGRERKG